MSENEIKKIKDVLFEHVPDMTDELAEKFFDLYGLMVKTNEVMNLTAITDFDEVLTKHYKDSLAVLKYINFDSLTEDDEILDLGTGAGFPGIPLKLIFPDISFTLLDSLKKRLDYIKNVCDELEIKKCKLVHGRAEELGHNEAYRERFSLVVSRAVAKLSVLSEYALPFVKTGGIFASYKADDIDEEIEEAKKSIEVLGGNIRSVERYSLGDEGERSLVLIEKISPTPKKYPRKASAIKNKPFR